MVPVVLCLYSSVLLHRLFCLTVFVVLPEQEELVSQGVRGPIEQT